MKQAELISLWKALADSKRRRIIQLLHEQARTTNEISTHFDVSRYAIMRHLKVLEQAGLIKTRREGRQRWNFLNEDMFQQIQQAYLGDETGNGYQLADILTFLARQEGAATRDHGGPEQPRIELEVLIQASPEDVFRALTEDIDQWWSYRFVADSHMRLEAQVGGRFYEAFNDGGGALYAFVNYLKPGEELHLNGSMGLADEGNNNTIYFSLQPVQDNQTLLGLTHRFLGLTSVVTIDTYNRSWVELLAQNLKTFIESGAHFKDRAYLAQRQLPIG